MLRGPLLAAMRRLNPVVPGEYLQQALAEIVAPTVAGRDRRELPHAPVSSCDGYRGISYIDSDGIEQNPTIRLVSRPVDDNDWLAVNQVTIRSRASTSGASTSCSTSTACRSSSSSSRRPARSTPTSPPRTRSCRRTCASSRWRSGSACFTSSATASPRGTARRSRRSTTSRRGTSTTTGSPSQPGTDVADDGPRHRARVPASTGSSTRSGSCSCCATSPPSTRAPTGCAKRIAKPHQYFAVTKAVGIDRRRRSRATARPASSGTPRARASRWRWSSTPTWSRGSRSCKNPTRRRRHRPQRARRPAVRDVQPILLLPRSPSQVTHAQRAARRAGQPHHRRHLLHHAAEVRPHRGREATPALDHPLLTDRRNIIVIVDEAHRSHYDDLDGYARHIRDALPNATLIAFTGTPISFADRNTREVFGDVHRHLRPHPGRRGRRHRAGVLRAAADQGAARRRRHRGDSSTRPPTRRPSGLDDVERARIEKSVAVDQRRLRRARAARRRSPTTSSRTGRAARERDATVHRRAPRQGDHRRRHPRDLRQPVRGDRRAAARTGTTTPSTRA